MSMNSDFNILMLKFFQVNNLEDVDVLKLEHLAGQYPYFAPVQYLLARKYKQLNSHAYKPQIAKTAIFFNNPHWLNDLLLSAEATVINENISAPAEPEIILPGTLPLEENIVMSEPESVPEPGPKEQDDFASGAENESIEPVLPSFDDRKIHIQETDELEESAENITHTVISESTQPSSPFKFGGFSVADAGNNQSLIPIEPLYTIDYFASQGIKLDEGEGKDKLSQKLRSFTEWLKTMKRIHPEKLEQEMDNKSSSVVQNIAEHSNVAEDILTEAMAEVYARQGLRNKAAEVYQKLSLLNPNKRTYFAAKISKLNET